MSDLTGTSIDMLDPHCKEVSFTHFQVINGLRRLLYISLSVPQHSYTVAVSPVTDPVTEL